MNSLTVKGATKYITNNYGKPKHDMSKLVKACKQTAKETNLKALDIFFLVIEDKPISGAFTHSYGFHTANGRALTEDTKFRYKTLTS